MGTILKDLLEACRTRENQHNLQLIVITHDQRLVEHLYAACRPEYVYGLSKEENGTSRIRIHRNIDEAPYEQV
jgi:DNA repair exonuclease SbcCD ATPase subunit